MRKQRYRHIGACRELVDIVEYYTSSKKRRNANWLESDLEDFYHKYGTGMLESFMEVIDTKFVFPSSAMHVLKPGMVARKASLYSGCSLCILPTKYSVARQKFVETDSLCTFVNRASAAIRKGKIIPILVVDMNPHYRQSVVEWKAGSFKSIFRKTDDNGLEQYAADTDSIPVFGEQNDLIRQINEDSEIEPYSTAGVHDLFFPVLNGIDLETMFEVMDDYGDPTARFRHALKGIIKEESGDIGDKILYKTMSRIDVEIRNLCAEMERISSDRALRFAETGVGLMAVGLSLCAPEWLAQTAAEMFGSLSVFDGTRKLLEVKKQSSKFRQNDFYLPWLLHQKK